MAAKEGGHEREKFTIENPMKLYADQWAVFMNRFMSPLLLNVEPTMAAYLVADEADADALDLELEVIPPYEDIINPRHEARQRALRIKKDKTIEEDVELIEIGEKITRALRSDHAAYMQDRGRRQNVIDRFIVQKGKMITCLKNTVVLNSLIEERLKNAGGIEALALEKNPNKMYRLLRKAANNISTDGTADIVSVLYGRLSNIDKTFQYVKHLDMYRDIVKEIKLHSDDDLPEHVTTMYWNNFYAHFDTKTRFLALSEVRRKLKHEDMLEAVLERAHLFATDRPTNDYFAEQSRGKMRDTPSSKVSLNAVETQSSGKGDKRRDKKKGQGGDSSKKDGEKKMSSPQFSMPPPTPPTPSKQSYGTPTPPSGGGPDEEAVLGCGLYPQRDRSQLV
jgi:hypothetical protein